MKIGLVRHFKVNVKPGKGVLTPSEFEQAMKNYDDAEVIQNPIKINSADWEICYSSSLPRAVKTARNIYKGEIVITDLLREVPILPFTNKNIFLPAFLWHTAARIVWFKNGISQPEGKSKSEERASKIFELLNSADFSNILIVSHGFFMVSLYKELTKRGFKGEMDFHPRNGKLYILKK